MLGRIKKFFSYNERGVSKLNKLVDEINKHEDTIRGLKDKDFINETKRLKGEIQSGKSLDEYVPLTFALTREASRRLLGERHYDTQLMAGIALHQGKVVEQKTGEGKTLAATAALYLNGLTGKGVHLVTVNDYLARRDAGWMGSIYHMLGLTVSAIISDKSYIYDPEYIDDQAMDWRLKNLRPITRKDAYKADITYGINSEFGFDYLRDNMARSKEDLVQRGFSYAIIDEVDSVLIDEARTPHIISAPYDEDVSKYYDYARIVRRLNPDTDYIIDEKLKTAHLTEKGVLKLEKMMNVDNIYEKDYDTLFHVEAALKARTLFIKDKDYIVKEQEVVIVDEFTGRLLRGRRFSEGIHQAIEAKEGVPIKKESRTLATVSLQNYFRMYDKLSGMTGTAATEAEEFSKIYGLDVMVLPTNRPMVRKDNADLIYKTERGKFSAVAEEIEKQYKNGRPVLVGTTSIEKNEVLSLLLKKKKIPHELLNAKNHEREATIITNAGKPGAITVATNMAGRGVDIKLGGEPPSRFEIDKDGNEERRKQDYEKQIKKWREEHDKVIKAGGLYVMGTDRHESRRIDNQLRGRSGRQGDPGETRFFVSLEDDMMRIFGGEQVSRLMTMFKIPENQPLEHAMVSKAIEQAQIKVEGFNFDIRKHLVEYDDVLNRQREILYKLRRKVLMSEGGVELKESLFKMFHQEIDNLVNAFLMIEGEVDFEKFAEEFIAIVSGNKKKLQTELEKTKKTEMKDMLLKKLEKSYDNQEKAFGKELWNKVLQFVMLSTIDKHWMEHLTAINVLREGIGLRGYAQLDPLTEYKNEAFSMFEKLLSDIDFEVSRRVLKIEPDGREKETTQKKEIDTPKMQLQSASSIDPYKKQGEPQGKQNVTISTDSQTTTTLDSEKDQQTKELESSGEVQEIAPGIKLRPPGKVQKKPGRNEPCWCGSGKKYKKCHYPD